MNRKPGDWDCGTCHHLNFSRRDSCQRCGEPKPGDRSEYGGFFGGGRIDFGGFGGGRSEYGGFGGGRSEYGGFGGGRAGSDVRPGDWYCPCGSHNFASRSTCFKCGAFKDETATAFDGGEAFHSRGYGMGSGGAVRAGWKSGDWICNRTGCNEHNFASRMECFRCNAPREAGAEV